ncbi:hypothetical protein D3C80_1764310 [compost metagenome]
MAGQVQPPTARSAAGTVATTGALLEAAGVAGLAGLTGVVTMLPAGRRMTVVLLDEDGLDTTVVLPLEPLLKRIACPGRMV